MVIKPEEITGILQKQIAEYETKLELKEVGYVIQVGDGIARIFGLHNAVIGELLEFPHNVFGMVLNLERENVGCILFGADHLIKEGDEVKRTGKVLEVSTGKHLLGRVVNPLGIPIDGKGDLRTITKRPIEVIATGVVERQPVNVPLQTGIKVIDSVIPIGRGQRELIIGDRQIGKTAIAIDTIINQKNEHNRPICVYVAIGQKQSTIAEVVQTLTDNGAMEYTIVVAASASDPAPLLYIAPYSGCAMAEEFMWQGKDVLIIYDDLSKHATAYRQLSLLLRRPPGREAYPGDVFYLHSRLLERACKLSKENGGGSITALPIIETQAGDISAYIPTNVISITDGQIYLENNLFFSGIRPAVNIGLSVSRVGGKAQIKAMRQVAGQLKMDIAQYNALAAFAQFSSDLDKTSKAQIARGQRMVEVLKQKQYSPLPVEKQIITIYCGTHGMLDDIPAEYICEFEEKLFAFIEKGHIELLNELKQKHELTNDIETKLKDIIAKFKETNNSFNTAANPPVL